MPLRRRSIMRGASWIKAFWTELGQILSRERCKSHHWKSYDQTGCLAHSLSIGSNLALSAACAALAVCLRPTSLPLWAYLGAEHTFRQVYHGRFSSAITNIVVATVSG